MSYKAVFSKLVAVGACSIALFGNASASTIIGGDADFRVGDVYTNHQHWVDQAGVSIDNQYDFTAGEDVRGITFALGVSDAGGSYSVQNLTAEWREGATILMTKAFTGATGAQSTYVPMILSMLSGHTYNLYITGTTSGNGGAYDLTVNSVPLPGAALLFGSALLGAGVLGRKKLAAKKADMAAA